MNSGSDNSGGGHFALRKSQTVEVKTLNAKKLDVNFEADDFFNSFQHDTKNNSSGIKSQ
jgi:hypothetical protein